MLSQGFPRIESAINIIFTRILEMLEHSKTLFLLFLHKLEPFIFSFRLVSTEKYSEWIAHDHA